MNSICATGTLWDLDIRGQVVIGYSSTCVETCDVPHPLASIPFYFEIPHSNHHFTDLSFYIRFFFLLVKKFQAIPINAYEKLYNNQYLIVQQIDGSLFYSYYFFSAQLILSPAFLSQISLSLCKGNSCYWVQPLWSSVLCRVLEWCPGKREV